MPEKKRENACLFMRINRLYSSCSWNRYISLSLVIQKKDKSFSNKITKLYVHICKVHMIKYYMVISSEGTRGSWQCCCGLSLTTGEMCGWQLPESPNSSKCLLSLIFFFFPLWLDFINTILLCMLIS